jgi:hypothetical protein
MTFCGRGVRFFGRQETAIINVFPDAAPMLGAGDRTSVVGVGMIDAAWYCCVVSCLRHTRAAVDVNLARKVVARPPVSFRRGKQCRNLVESDQNIVINTSGAWLQLASRHGGGPTAR